MPTAMSRIRSRRAATLAVVASIAFVLLPVSPAAAWSEQYSWSSVTVSCNHGTYQWTINNAQQLITSTMYVSQTADTHNVVGEYHLQSSQGNNTSAKTAGTGQVVSWNSVLPSTYTVWHTAHVSVNCNGVLPGNGNTSVSGWVRLN